MEINIFGFHSVFYYYGLQHLNINMYKYIKEGIENGEVIYLCTDEETSCEMKNISTNYSTHIKKLPLDSFVEIYNSVGKSKAREYLCKCAESVMQEGYNGMRIIAQSTHIINKISVSKFLDIEKELDELICGINISILCIYDFEDYIKEKLLMTDEVIEGSYDTHKHRLYNMSLVSSDNCFK